MRALLLPAYSNSPQEQFNYNEKNTLENLILKLFYRNYSNNGYYSTFSGVNQPEVKLEKNRVIIKVHVLENFTVWGKGMELAMDNINLEIINETRGIYKIEDFETMNLSKGEHIMIEAKMPQNYGEYIAGLDFKREN